MPWTERKTNRNLMMMKKWRMSSRWTAKTRLMARKLLVES